MWSYLRQSTATQSRIVGPFIDDTDFKTLETALTIANTDIKLSANGGASVNKNSGGATHIANGMYSVTFNATDTATVGELAVSIKMSGALIVVAKFLVLEESVYDSLFAASAAGVWSSDEKAALRTILGIPASGVTPEDPTDGILDDIRDLVVTGNGQIESIDADLATVATNVLDIQNDVNALNTLTGAFSNDNPADGVMSLVRGASYDNVMNDKITFAVTDSADLDNGSYTATLYVVTKQNKALFSTTGTITNVTGNEYTVAFTVSASNTSKLPLGADVANYSMTITGPTSSVATPHVGIVECLYDYTGKRA